MNYCFSDFFVDDALIHTHDIKVDKAEEKLQYSTDNENGWSQQNKMHINYDKTNYTILERANKKSLLQEFSLNIFYLK